MHAFSKKFPCVLVKTKRGRLHWFLFYNKTRANNSYRFHKKKGTYIKHGFFTWQEIHDFNKVYSAPKFYPRSHFSY